MTIPSDPPSTSKKGFLVRELTPGDIVEARAVIVRVLEEDLGYGYVPEWHWDLDDMQTVYLANPRQALFVAVDNASSQIVGTTAVRTGGPKSPPHPLWLAERYDSSRTAQLMRVYVVAEQRRRGIARALVEAAKNFVKAEGGYDVIYLHTSAGIPGAEAFWRSAATTEVYDARGEDTWNAIHFEINW